MGYEYSMNVFICGNLTTGNEGILKKVIHKIFKKKEINLIQNLRLKMISIFIFLIINL